MKTISEQLQAFRSGDQAAFTALLERYRPMIAGTVRSFLTTYPTLDSEDLMQEASLAFARAATAYDLNKSQVTFGLYAKICVKNRLISLVRKERVKTEKKKLKDRTPLPEKQKNLLPPNFSISELLSESLLSPFEKQVLTLKAKGCSYAEIAVALQCNEKSVDNALYRIKKKIRTKLTSTE